MFGYIDPGTGFTLATSSGWFIAIILAFLGTILLFFKKIFNFLKKHWKIFLAILLIALIGGGIYLGVIMTKNGTEFKNKIVILGYDGLSPKIVERLLAESKLPAFKKLIDQGSYARLGTTNPPQSPVAWSGFATGRNPGKHGVFDFIMRSPKDYMLSLSLSQFKDEKPVRPIHGKAFWNYTSEKKVSTILITHPITFPPDKIYGKMLSGMGVPDILGTEGTFTFYTTEPLEKDKDIGGKVFQVRKSSEILMNLIGPKLASGKGQAENVKVPFMANIQGNKALIKFQNKETELKVGKWSDWQEVSFKLGFLKKAKGIFKFYLVETEPEFKLYISPINMDPRDPLFQISYPKNYSKELAEALGLYYTQGMPMDTWSVNEKRLSEKPFLEQVNVILKEKIDMLHHELNQLKNGLIYCYFESSDIMQHMFWRYTDPDHPLYNADAPQEYKDMIENWYIKLDNVLANLMQRLDPEDTLIVLSDHGFDTFRRSAHINTWLRLNGYLTLRDDGADAGQELLLDVDWSRTKAYAIGFGAIYINQEGREKYGIVKPGLETENLKKEIAEKIAQWQDDKFQKPIVSKVYPREEAFWGDLVEETPDLYVGFNIGYRASWQTALGATPESLIEDNLKKWSGSHLFDPALVPGVILTNKKITKDDPSIYDITPTILKQVGYTDEEMAKMDLDGKPLF
ncbi:MAG: alkaline phosphatase family protein [Pseudomonadota bacterium]